MSGLNFNSRERRWRIYHKFENKQRSSSLKKLSERDGFELLKELYRFAFNSSPGLSFNKLDNIKIKTLTNIHSMFGKVKV